ncbi:Shell matrix protein, partial [Balamuthia mandrillaris]
SLHLKQTRSQQCTLEVQNVPFTPTDISVAYDVTGWVKSIHLLNATLDLLQQHCVDEEGAEISGRHCSMILILESILFDFDGDDDGGDGNEDGTDGYEDGADRSGSSSSQGSADRAGDDDEDDVLPLALGLTFGLLFGVVLVLVAFGLILYYKRWQVKHGNRGTAVNF